MCSEQVEGKPQLKPWTKTKNREPQFPKGLDVERDAFNFKRLDFYESTSLTNEAFLGATVSTNF